MYKTCLKCILVNLDIPNGFIQTMEMIDIIGTSKLTRLHFKLVCTLPYILHSSEIYASSRYTSNMIFGYFFNKGPNTKRFFLLHIFFGYLLLITIGVMNDERLENFLWSITSSFSKVFPPKKPKHQKTFGTFFWHFYILSKVVCKNFYSISLILIKVYSQTPDVTANAKDSEVRYKKVYGFWFIHLKNWNTSH